jgi:hypothetical protein
MEVKPGTSVYVLDKVISDELCKTLKVIIDNTDGRKLVYSPGNNVQTKEIVIGDLKNPDFAKVIDDKVKNVVSDIIRRIINLSPYIDQIRGDEGYQYRKIHGPTRLHTDNILYSVEAMKNVTAPLRSIRKLSLIIALNSDYEGGEFVFPSQNLKVKLKQGQAILFPPYWTHPHGTRELQNGTFRYTINTWLLE